MQLWYVFASACKLPHFGPGVKVGQPPPQHVFYSIDVTAGEPWASVRARLEHKFKLNGGGSKRHANAACFEGYLFEADNMTPYVQREPMPPTYTFRAADRLVLVRMPSHMRKTTCMSAAAAGVASATVTSHHPHSSAAAGTAPVAPVAPTVFFAADVVAPPDSLQFNLSEAMDPEEAAMRRVVNEASRLQQPTTHSTSWHSQARASTSAPTYATYRNSHRGPAAAANTVQTRTIKGVPYSMLRVAETDEEKKQAVLDRHGRMVIVCDGRHGRDGRHAPPPPPSVTVQYQAVTAAAMADDNDDNDDNHPQQAAPC